MNEKDWVGSKNSVFRTLGASNHSKTERAQRDFYATDPNTIKELFNEETFSDNIWECASGMGHLVKPMKEYGKSVTSTDIYDYGCQHDIVDFLKINGGLWSGDIITNPPYKYAREFLENGMKLIQEKSKIALFLKLTFLEGQKRYDTFQKYPPKTVYVYSRRRKCALNGDFEGQRIKSSAVCYAWFVWEKGFTGEPTIRWIK